jgi:hypothetical protein
MGGFTFFILVIFLSLGIIFENLWNKNNKKYEQMMNNKINKNIENFYKHLPSIYDKYYATIHMLNYFHHNCNENNLNNLVIAQKYFKNFFYDKDSLVCEKKAEGNVQKFRYKNFVLLNNGQMCNADINLSNGEIEINSDTCDKLENWYKKKIISSIDFHILENFMPPMTNSLKTVAGVFFQGVSGYEANILTTVPFLKMKGILFEKTPGYNSYKPIKY